MRVLFVGYLHGFGGAEKQMIMLANELVQRNYDVEFVSLFSDNACYDIDKRIKRKFIEDKSFSIFKIFNRYLNLKKEIKRYKPDVIINFWFQSAYFTALMSKKITGKIIYSERGDPGDKEYKGLLGLVRKIVLPKIDGFVFQTSGARDYFTKKVIERSVIIPNPINTANYHTVDYKNRKNKVVTVGRLHNQKNMPLLINAFAEISKDYPNFHLEIYGEGDKKEEFVDLISSLGMDGKIILKGAVKNVQDCINDSKLFVLSSDYEGMPNALLEAMSLGLSCISTDWNPGGVKDIINNNKNGLIVPKGDKEALKKAMKKMLDDEVLAKKCGEQAQIDSHKYQPKNIYDKWEGYINSLK